MNKVLAMGFLTRDPEVRWSQDGQTCIARYTLAINRPKKSDDPNAQNADFPSCVAFGKSGEFAEKYLHKGMKIAIEGHLQTGSYTAKDGYKVYTTDIVVDKHFFCESKQAQDRPQPQYQARQDQSDGFMNIPDEIQEELPFL